MKAARDIYDNFIMKELLSHSHVSIFNFILNAVFYIVMFTTGLFKRVSTAGPKTPNEKRFSRNAF